MDYSPTQLSPETLGRLLQQRPIENEPLPDIDFSLLRAIMKLQNQEVKSIFTEHGFKAGEVIFQENAPGDTLGIIWSGRVVIVKGDLSDPDQAPPTILGYRNQWEIIGEMALLDNRPRSASIIAVEPTRLLITDRAGFHNLLEEPNTVGLTVLETLSIRLRQSDSALHTSEIKEQRLNSQVSELESEKQALLELQRVRQETADLIVHDLRNPLGSIHMALRAIEMVLPEGQVEEAREILYAALSSCGRMQRLVDSMLEVSRMESGEASLVMSKFSLGPMIETMAANMRVLQKDRCTIETRFAPDLPPITADRDKIERVLANLLDNAVKHSPLGGKITIEVQTAPNQVRLSVVDSGPGIPADERSRIFERFSQVAGEKARQRGFGLGLTYCKLTVEAHGGKIWVEEGDGGPEAPGSRFVFTLPLA